MRFHRLAVASTALLAVGVFSGHQGIARAEDAPVQIEETDATGTPEPYAPPEGSESFEFQAEVNRMLDIVVNSLYQNKDVFLRELISNASDALDKIRFLSLTKPELLADKEELEVQIEYDAEANTLTVRDTGVGMTHDDLVENLGTVARSGTTKFMEALEEGSSDMGMIGQFGVGFYSAFLVSDRLTVASKHPSDSVQYIWESVNGESSFYVAPDPRGNTLGRGTEITLHLKDDAVEYAEAHRLRDLVSHYSEFVTHPISLRVTSTVTVDVEDEEEEEKKEEKEGDEFEVEEEDADAEEKVKETREVTTYEWEKINTNPPIWTRSKEDITDDEYQAFFKVAAKDMSSGNASTWSHFNAEGNINFQSILYLPEELPPHLQNDFRNSDVGGMKLYVRKVLISDEFDLMPRYLSFIRGVVDSDDLPLNVNRETLQESKIIQVVKKKLVRKAIEMIRKFSQEEGKPAEVAEAEIDADGNVEEKEQESVPPPYNEWYRKFGQSIKMGVIDDEPNRGKLSKLLRFDSSKSEDGMISLEDYVGRMKDWQKDIYVFAGVSKADLETSDFMEKFNEKDLEVIFLTETVDEYMIQHMREFDGKKFTAITKDGLKFNDEDEDLLKRREKYYKNQFKPLTKWLKQIYGPAVMKISISKRLGSTPAIVSSSDYGPGANMERIMRAQAFNAGQDENQMRAMRILEINPRHPVIHKLLDGCPPEDDEEAKDFVLSDEIVDSAWMMFDMATLNGGFPIDDKDAYSTRTMRLLKNQMGIESLALEDEINPPVEEDEAPEIDLDGMNAGGINLDDYPEMMNMDDFDV